MTEPKLIDVTSGFIGYSAPLHEVIDDIHRRGWTVAKIHVKDNQYVAEGKNPHGEKLTANGRTDATAAANLLIKIMRRDHMRASSTREKLGAWDPAPIEQQWSQIAQAYAGAPVYEAKAAVAWMDLAQDCQRRVQVIRQQINVEFTADPVPYQDLNELRDDVTKKRHIWITRAFAHHPVWSEQQMLDYRLVVDVLGHAVGGGDWGWHGTCMAFAALAPMLGEGPQKALFSELLGQAAFGSFYRQWGPQKICFLKDIIDSEQAKENKPGHTGVHPSQSIVPSVLPRIGATGHISPLIPSKRSDMVAKDPNDGWESGVAPLPDNAYMWQRDETGTDPLQSQNLTDSLRELEPGVTRMHPEQARQAVVNALRSSLLGSRNNDMGHAIHYQDLSTIPAGVDDPMAFWDALEQRREAWNSTRGYAPGSHKQHWAEEQKFKQWVKAANPQLDDGDVNRLAKSELLHMLTEEEERITAQDPDEQYTAEQIEHEAFNALKGRLRSLTKPTADEKVDFGDDHLFHEAALDPGAPSTMNWQPGQWGKGFILDNQLHTWPTDGGDVRGGAPHHGDMLTQNGIPNWHDDRSRWSDTIVINPEGYYVHNCYNDQKTPAVTRFAQAHPALKYDPRERRIWSKTATHHADMYPPYLASRLRSLALVGRHADELSDAAREDMLTNRGHGHKFRSTALKLGIPGLGPRQVSNTWMHVAPQTSQLGVIGPEVAQVLGRDYSGSANRDYFKHERELAAGRDAAGYGHVPLGAFSTGLRDLATHGPGIHPDRSAFKAQSPTPWSSIDWNSQGAGEPTWDNPYWWQSTQPVRDEVGKDFDRTIAVDHPAESVPFQKQAANEWRAPEWLKNPANRVPCPACEGYGFNHALDQDICSMCDGKGFKSSPNPGGDGWENTIAPWDTVQNIDPAALGPKHFGATAQSPWVTHPMTGARLTGAPGTSLMSHIKQTFGHPDCQSVWGQDYDCGKGSGGTISKVAAAPMYHVTDESLRPRIEAEGLRPGMLPPNGSGQPQGVYLYSDPEYAAMSPVWDRSYEEGQQPVLYEVNTQGIDVQPDPEEGHEGRQWYTPDAVGPERLRHVPVTQSWHGPRFGST